MKNRSPFDLEIQLQNRKQGLPVYREKRIEEVLYLFNEFIKEKSWQICNSSNNQEILIQNVFEDISFVHSFVRNGALKILMLSQLWERQIVQKKILQKRKKYIHAEFKVFLC